MRGRIEFVEVTPVSASCCGTSENALNSRQWRRALWIALAVNAGMFALETGAGVASESMALRADALDFLGDAANYAISLAVVGMTLAWRARAALLKGATLALFGVWIMGSAIWAAIGGTSPEAPVMGAIGLAALIANVGVAAMLYRYRSGDANMRSVWICSRNDAIGNVGAPQGLFAKPRFVGQSENIDQAARWSLLPDSFSGLKPSTSRPSRSQR